MLQGLRWLDWYVNYPIFTFDRVAGEIIHSAASVGQSVYLALDSLTVERFDLWPWFLAWQLILTMAWLGLQAKVVGQRPMSNGNKLCFDGLEYAFYTMCMLWSGRYMGSACQVLRKITMTHGIQSKISVCLSVIKELSRSARAACSGRGILILI